MKTLVKYIASIGLLSAATPGLGQSDYNAGVKVNRITTKSILVPVTNESSLNTLTNEQQVISSTYTDGMGKTIQTVSQNNNNLDVVKPIVYDEFDRIVTDKMPYISGNNHKFKRNVYSQQYLWNNAQYPEENGFSYSTTTYDDLSLNREIKYQNPGKDNYQQNAPVFSSSSVMLNTAAEGIRIWSATSPDAAPSSNSIWQDNKLVVKIYKDGDGNIRRLYFDKSGKLLLEKQSVVANPDINQHDGWKCTYYIYDVYDRLIQILSPKLVAHLSTNAWQANLTDFNELANWFKYDHRNRIIENKKPGADPIKYVYNNLDLLVMSQDGNLDQKKEWMVYKHDIYNRIILKGIYRNPEALSQTQLQSFLETENDYDAVLKLLNTKIADNNYTTSDQIAKLDILQLNYFDYYNNPDQFVPDIFSQSNTNVTLSRTKETYGLITESASRLFEGEILMDNWEQKTIYYDKKARPIQVHSINATGGNDTTSINYDFTGKVISTISSVHNATAANVDEGNVKLNQHFIYDKNNLESIFQKFDKDPYYRKVVHLEYDDFGRVKNETLGAVEERNYKYNMIGKLLSINNDYYEGLHNNNFFGEKINYDFSNNKSYMPHELLWRQKGSEHTQRRYSYSYDHLKRLTAANYHQSEDGFNWSKSQEDYSLLDLTYDLNGNTLSMKQWGTSAAFNNPFLMDDLTYGYRNNGQSNQLDYVTDMVTTDFGLGEFTEPSQNTSKDYNYQNGNAIADANREIERMNYGIFSKPTNVQFDNGNKIQFNYGADYQLKSKIIDDQVNGKIKQIDYINGIEYVDHQLSQIPITNGSARLVSIVDNNADTIKCYEYDYHIKDHFGNVKSVVTESPDQNWYQYTNNNYIPVAFQQTSLGLGFTRQDKQYLATFENGNAVLENALFDKIDSVRDNKLNSSDPNDQSAARLNATYNTIGALKLIRVLSGDVVNAESQYFFDSNNSYDNNGTPSNHNVLNMVFQSLTGGGTSIFTENTATNIFNNINVNHWNEAFTSIAVQDNHDGAHPTAFMNLLFFDEKMQLKQNLSRRIQVENPDNWNDLQGELEITQNGYILAFISNQSNGDVYFDNFNITHKKGALLQESHYYPYGLTLTTAPYTIVSENKNLFLGKTLERGEFGNRGLNLYNFDHRMYDPQIGRFHASDPLAALAPSWSPYRYGFNNPVVFSDPSGLYEEGDPWDWRDYDDGGDGREYETRFGEVPASYRYNGINEEGQDEWLYTPATYYEYMVEVKQDDFQYDPGATLDHPEFDDYENEVQPNDGNPDRPFGKGEFGDRRTNYVPPPKDKKLPGFPEAGVGKYHPESQRVRWRLPNGDIAEWDKEKGEVEIYDKNGKNHKGGFDPNDRHQRSPSKPGRTTPKIDGIDWQMKIVDLYLYYEVNSTIINNNILHTLDQWNEEFRRDPFNQRPCNCDD